MQLSPPSPQPFSSGAEDMPTLAKVTWIDLYRFRLGALIPEMTPYDAVTLAVDAYGFEYARRGCPIKAAEAYASSAVSPKRHCAVLHACLGTGRSQ